MSWGKAGLEFGRARDALEKRLSYTDKGRSYKTGRVNTGFNWTDSVDSRGRLVGGGGWSPSPSAQTAMGIAGINKKKDRASISPELQNRQTPVPKKITTPRYTGQGTSIGGRTNSGQININTPTSGAFTIGRPSTKPISSPKNSSEIIGLIEKLQSEVLPNTNASTGLPGFFTKPASDPTTRAKESSEANYYMLTGDPRTDDKIRHQLGDRPRTEGFSYLDPKNLPDIYSSYQDMWDQNKTETEFTPEELAGRSFGWTGEGDVWEYLTKLTEDPHSFFRLGKDNDIILDYGFGGIMYANKPEDKIEDTPQYVSPATPQAPQVAGPEYQAPQMPPFPSFPNVPEVSDPYIYPSGLELRSGYTSAGDKLSKVKENVSTDLNELLFGSPGRRNRR